MTNTNERMPQDHAIGVASEHDAYQIDGKLVYISRTRRQQHSNARWGFFEMVVYRPIFEAAEYSMPAGKFYSAAKKTGLTVAQEVQHAS